MKPRRGDPRRLGFPKSKEASAQPLRCRDPPAESWNDLLACIASKRKAMRAV